MPNYVEAFEVPGVGSLWIENRKTLTGQEYYLWCNGFTFGVEFSLKPARERLAHHAHHQLSLEKSDLLSRLEVINGTLRLLVGIQPDKISEFQVELKEDN